MSVVNVPIGVIGLSFVNGYDILLALPRMGAARLQLWASWEHQIYGGRDCERFPLARVSALELNSAFSDNPRISLGRLRKQSFVGIRDIWLGDKNFKD